MFSFDVPPLTGAVLSGFLIIFVLRVVGITLSTLRMLVMVRGGKLLAAVMGFFEVLVYVLAIGEVVNNLSNVWNILSYCLGFVVGTLIGMWMEERLALGYATMSIMSREKGIEMADAIRGAGYGATISWGAGRDGAVGLVTAIVRRGEVKSVQKIADQVDPNAFVSVSEARTVHRGYVNVPHTERG